MRGFGTVVTGTLVGGALAVGDSVELLPSGRRGRVRGLQSHGAEVEVAAPGARTAVNLHGVEVAEVARGDLLAAADALAPTLVFDASVHWFANAQRLEERDTPYAAPMRILADLAGAGGEAFEIAPADDPDDLSREARVLVPEADYDRAYRLFYEDKENEL